VLIIIKTKPRIEVLYYYEQLTDEGQTAVTRLAVPE